MGEAENELRDVPRRIARERRPYHIRVVAYLLG